MPSVGRPWHLLKSIVVSSVPTALRLLYGVRPAKQKTASAGGRDHPPPATPPRTRKPARTRPPSASNPSQTQTRTRGGVLRLAPGQPGARGLAADPGLRRQGHRHAAGGAAPGDREGRCIGGGQAGHEAVARGEERPQADVRGRRRLRRRPGPADAGGRHQHPRAEAEEEESAGQEGEATGAAGPRQVADRLGHRRHPRRHRRRVRRGRAPRPRPPAGMGGADRREQHPDRGRRRGGGPRSSRWTGSWAISPISAGRRTRSRHTLTT
jgi:hypothetical protein